jgi:hypothetical protein
MKPAKESFTGCEIPVPRNPSKPTSTPGIIRNGNFLRLGYSRYFIIDDILRNGFHQFKSGNQRFFPYPGLWPDGQYNRSAVRSTTCLMRPRVSVGRIKFLVACPAEIKCGPCCHWCLLSIEKDIKEGHPGRKAYLFIPRLKTMVSAGPSSI